MENLCPVKKADCQYTQWPPYDSISIHNTMYPEFDPNNSIHLALLDAVFNWLFVYDKNPPVIDIEVINQVLSDVLPFVGLNDEDVYMSLSRTPYGIGNIAISSKVIFLKELKRMQLENEQPISDKHSWPFLSPLFSIIQSDPESEFEHLTKISNGFDALEFDVPLISALKCFAGTVLDACNIKTSKGSSS